MDGLPQPSRLPDPRDRRETEAWLDRRSEQLAESIARSLKKVVTSAYEKFLATLPETTIVSSLTAAGDFHTFDSIIGQWKLIYEKEIAPEIEETYLSGAMSAFTQAPGTDAMSDEEVASWARVTNDQAVSYMADATNRLSGVGDTIWTDVRSRVADAVASGMSNEELKDQIGKLSDFSEYRADTIARTETIGAYVNGDWNGAQLLGEFGPVEKVWVATGDARGREWHTEMMTESIPVDEPFDVDGEPMMYPHDPSGSAFNVVNCRCYVEFLYPGDTRPDGSVIPEPGTGAEGEDELEEIADEELTSEVSADVSGPYTMSPSEANEWSKDSVYTDNLYHGTTVENAQGITQNGFRPTTDKQTSGVFLTPSRIDAASYVDRALRNSSSQQGELLTLRVNVQKMATSADWERALDVATETPFTPGLSRRQQTAELGDRITSELKRQGFDGVVGPQGNLDEVVIFDPENIRVVSNAVDPLAPVTLPET